MFERLLISIREEVTRVLMHANIQLQEPPPPPIPEFITRHIDPFSGEDDSADIDAATGTILSSIPPMAMPRQDFGAVNQSAVDIATSPVSRNAPCPCGSGKKYKHCHGQLA